MRACAPSVTATWPSSSTAGARRPAPSTSTFLRDGAGSAARRVVGLDAGRAVDTFLPGGLCAPGEQLEAIVDPRSEVDEADEENDALSVTC